MGAQEPSRPSSQQPAARCLHAAEEAIPFTYLTPAEQRDLRLACQCRVKGDCTIEVQPEFNWSGENFWQKPYPNK